MLDKCEKLIIIDCTIDIIGGLYHECENEKNSHRNVSGRGSRIWRNRRGLRKRGNSGSRRVLLL